MKLKKIKTAAVLILSAFILVGCQSKEKQQFRLTGIEQLDAGEYEAAIQSFKQALDNSDGRVGEFELDVLKYRAEAEFKLEDFEAAAHTYDVLFEVDGEKAEYLVRGCILHTKAGDLDEALEGYGQLYEIQPESEDTAQALLTLGQALTDAGRYDEAMELYEEAVNNGMESGELYNRMALDAIEAGEYDQALEFISRGLLTGDEDVTAELLFNQTVAYEKKLDFASALSSLETYAARYETTPEIEKELAFLRTR